MMSDKMIENNQVSIVGEVVSDFTFSHEVFGEGFYMLNVSVKRLSDSCDIIPLMISERLLDVKEDYIGGGPVSVLQSARGEEEPSGSFCICKGTGVYG